MFFCLSLRENVAACVWKAKLCGEENQGAKARERERVPTGDKVSMCGRKVPFS